MPRPCLERGCDRLVARGSRCPHHQAQYEAARRASPATGRSAASRYVTANTRAAIHRRDGNRCHLCGELVLLDVPWTHPLAPELDHIVALADGGLHHVGNLATAHRSCNGRKASGEPTRHHSET